MMSEKEAERLTEKFPRLEEVRRLLRSRRVHLPYIIEITGLPKAGKTVLLRNLKRLFQQLGLQVAVAHEAATEKVPRIYRNDPFLFNILCTAENLTKVLHFS